MWASAINSFEREFPKWGHDQAMMKYICPQSESLGRNLQDSVGSYILPRQKS